MRRRGAKSFVDDLVLSRGVVLSRADLFCDLLRLSPLTRRFVRFRRTYLHRKNRLGGLPRNRITAVWLDRPSGRPAKRPFFCWFFHSVAGRPGDLVLCFLPHKGPVVAVLLCFFTLALLDGPQTWDLCFFHSTIAGRPDRLTTVAGRPV